MKAITIHQPWVWAIFNENKDIENRTWKTSYRGPLLIHAGLSAKSLDVKMPTRRTPKNLEFGAIVGLVDLVDCIKDSSSKWAMENHFHWVLKNPIVFDSPIKAKGQQLLWVPSEDIIKQLQA